MNTEVTPEGDLFDRLMAAMPTMAEAVNAFDLKDNQRTVLSALLGAAGVPVGQPAQQQVIAPEKPLSVVPPLAEVLADLDESVDENDENETTTPAPLRRVRKAPSKRTYTRIKDINFRPEGKQSLRDMVAEKQPTNFHEKNLLFVFYFEEVLEAPSITVGHVLAAYEECGEKAPAIPDNSLMVTAARKGWLDTSELQSGGIKTTHGGRNTVKYDMPIKKDKKSA